MRVRHRRIWLLPTGICLLFILTTLFSIHDAFPTSWLFAPNAGITRSHFITKYPIPSLMAHAKNSFINRLVKQSSTFSEAVIEYKRRYGRDPPRGFDDWWAFAMENDFKLVDEFDAIVEDLAPFWSMTGVELRRRAFQMGHLPSIDLVRLQDGEVFEVPIEKDYQDADHDRRSTGFRELLRKFQHKLPNMDFPINSKAEGRVLVPWEHLHYPNLTTQDSSGGVAAMLGDFTPDWRGESGVWEAYRRTCPPNSRARQLYSSLRDSNALKPGKSSRESGDLDGSFGFAEVPDYEFDFCRHPWARYTQGHFFSDWRTIPVLFPVFSPSKAKGFADIRIPSHYYHLGSSKHTYAWDEQHREVKDIDVLEIPWEKKSDRIFWRGATTGGGSTPPGFSASYQRHRFVRMSHEDVPINITIVHASPSRPDVFISTSIPAKNVNSDIMDVAFVNAVGSYPGGEEELRRLHRFADSVPLGKHWSYKYLIDLDGMSYSARFLAFLASDSAVIKSTVYKEFFSDWIQPWLHYIPISSSYAEIYNIHAYFSGPSASTIDAANVTVKRQSEWDAVKQERDVQLRQIARAGKQWKHTIGRHVDMEVYMYRLMLEYARLWSDDRDAMSFVL